MNKKGDAPVTIIALIALFILASSITYPFLKSSVLWFGNLNTILKFFFFIFGLFTLYLAIYLVNSLYY